VNAQVEVFGRALQTLQIYTFFIQISVEIFSRDIMSPFQGAEFLLIFRNDADCLLVVIAKEPTYNMIVNGDDGSS
jgi:hypothetical protein